MPRRCAACSRRRQRAAPWRRCAPRSPANTRRCPKKSRLFGFERHGAEVAALIQRGQESESDAGGARRVADRVPQQIAARVRPVFLRPVEIVKFRHRGVACLEHFHEKLGRHDLQVVGRNAIRQRIHGLPPGPKTIARRAPIFSIAGHGALEGMTVRVGHAGNHDPRDVDFCGAGNLHLRRGARIDRGDHPPLGDAYPRIACPALRQVGRLQTVSCHLGCIIRRG